MKEPWDRKEGEPAKAYAAFLSYRELGPSRSLNGAYKHFLVSKGRNPSETIKASGQWRDWSVSYDWKSRAEAWDLSQVKHRERVRLQTDEEEYARSVSEYHDWLRSHGKASAQIAAKALAEVKKHLDLGHQAIHPAKLNALVNAAVRLGEMGKASQENGLFLNELGPQVEE